MCAAHLEGRPQWAAVAVSLLRAVFSPVPRIPVHVQDTGTPAELSATQGGGPGPASPAEAPAAVQPGEQDPPEPRCCPQAPGSKSEKQALEGAGACPPLPVRSSDGGTKAEDQQGPAPEPATGPRGARRDLGAGAGALGLQQDRGPGAGSPEPQKDRSPGGPDRAEAGRTPQGAEAYSLVLGE